MNSKLFKLIIVFLFITLNSTAQDLEEIKLMLKDEFQLIDRYYDDRIFLDISEGIDTVNVRINSCRKISDHLKPKDLSYFDVILVNVSVVNLSTIIPSKNIFDTANFEYVLVESYGSYIKLFGFSTTNINYLRYTFRDENSYTSFILWLCTLLQREQVLSNSEAKHFKNSILRKKLFYSDKVHRPVNIINQLYPNRLYPSAITDYEWIKPILVN